MELELPVRTDQNITNTTSNFPAFALSAT